jgi:predicted nicotinamide N-methyase
VTVSQLEFHGRAIKLVRPADPDRLLDDPQVRRWNQHDDYMPYWAYLWPGAFLLAEAVAREPWPFASAATSRLRFLEIGCGVGLAGLVALKRGHFVCFTDYDHAPLDFVTQSASLNGFLPGSYATRVLDWRDVPEDRYQIILGSDVLYERRLVPLVANLLADCLEPGGVGLISCPGRMSAEGFGREVTSLGLSCGVEAIEAVSEADERIQGTLYRVSKGH